MNLSIFHQSDKPMTHLEYMVDIPMCVYNHGKFVAHAIEGVLMQKTDFKFRLIIGEDCSTDDSRTIVDRYSRMHPNIVHPIFHEKNLGASENTRILLQECHGKYLALCDGDDYWTDPFKLQKQVDFLEKNPDFMICFHNTEEKYDEGLKESFLYCAPTQKQVSTTEDLLRDQNFIPTCSAVFRNKLISKMPEFFFQLGMGDWTLHILNSEFGKINYINEVMAVHRLHANGIWSQNASIKNHLYILQAYEALASHFKSNSMYSIIIKEEKVKLLNSIFSHYFTTKEKSAALRYLCWLIKLQPSTMLKTQRIKEFIKLIIN